MPIELDVTVADGPPCEWVGDGPWFVVNGELVCPFDPVVKEAKSKLADDVPDCIIARSLCVMVWEGPVVPWYGML